ncbi:MAG: TetR/AcrR family transcriptional regulator [Myxococcota bacterium]
MEAAREQPTDEEKTESAFRKFLRRPPKQARSRALVEALIESLDELLSRGETLDQLTLGTLVRRAGVGVGSFYEYFVNKDALLGALIGTVTRENFQRLLQQVERSEADGLSDVLERISSAVARTYLSHPTRMRAIVNGIGRLRLLEHVVRERDRFANELGRQLHERYLSKEELQRVQETVRIISDGAMGIVSGELYRENNTDRAARQILQLANAVVEHRHPSALSPRS